MNLFAIIAVLAAFSVNVVFSQRWSKKKVELCRSGDGSSYRGFINRSAIGRKCLNWNRQKHLKGASKGLGDHNYCRNPDYSLMPWCLVRRRSRIVREFCDIPRCSNTGSRPTVKPQPQPTMDTEQSCGERVERRMNKIVGGSFTPIESHPWVAAIFHKRYGFLCGGSLISPCWVLTAAHCFTDGENTKIPHLSVYLGKSAINDTDVDKEQQFFVEKLIIHQKYNDSNYDSDIALVKIKSRNATTHGGCAVRSPTVRTVCLPPLHTQLPAGFSCSIAGFGKEKFESPRFSQYLKQADVKLLSRAECTSGLQYGSRITDNMFCAGSPSWSTDACKGDSGGPLVCEASGRMFLFGVVSWGEGCGWMNKPGVYTQVTNYNKWIAAKTGLTKYTRGLMYPQK
ncbi:plasminogen activator, urokinase a isoform X2 [Stegastes partitus]|uniref:trypsin n=1 Tax=Stegastes partitus TaxID=144197 RepID=A0A9Y4NEI4_9TELE|nr:PREDICTED: tissue-type plasminogen activator-like isoform X2 [Stegastes partitus]